MKIKTRETREGKIKQFGLPVIDCIKSYLSTVSKTKSKDEPKTVQKNNYLLQHGLKTSLPYIDKPEIHF